MNWDAIGAIGDAIAATGVIISLIYLAVQIRRQTLDNRIAVQVEATNELNSAYGALANDRELASNFYRGIRDLDSLDAVEQVQFGFYITRFFRCVESLVAQQVRGRVEDSFWTGVEEGMAEICKYPGVKIWWKSREHVYSSDMRKFISPMTRTQEQPSFYEQYRARS